MGKKLNDVSLEDMDTVFKAMNINAIPTDELRLAALELLRGRDIHEVSDLIKSPESLTVLGNFIQGKSTKEETRDLVQCPHCNGFFLN